MSGVLEQARQCLGMKQLTHAQAIEKVRELGLPKIAGRLLENDIPNETKKFFCSPYNGTLIDPDYNLLNIIPFCCKQGYKRVWAYSTDDKDYKEIAFNDNSWEIWHSLSWEKLIERLIDIVLEHFSRKYYDDFEKNSYEINFNRLRNSICGVFEPFDKSDYLKTVEYNSSLCIIQSSEIDESIDLYLSTRNLDALRNVVIYNEPETHHFILGNLKNQQLLEDLVKICERYYYWSHDPCFGAAAYLDIFSSEMLLKHAEKIEDLLSIEADGEQMHFYTLIPLIFAFEKIIKNTQYKPKKINIVSIRKVWQETIYDYGYKPEAKLKWKED